MKTEQNKNKGSIVSIVIIIIVVVLAAAYIIWSKGLPAKNVPVNTQATTETKSDGQFADELSASLDQSASVSNSVELSAIDAEFK